MLRTLEALHELSKGERNSPLPTVFEGVVGAFVGVQGLHPKRRLRFNRRLNGGLGSISALGGKGIKETVSDKGDRG